ncbi:MAG: hypothetical protein J6A89_06325 [Clostridia bacterium]|nr:hypothetical protein [Clostridia bacterium]
MGNIRNKSIIIAILLIILVALVSSNFATEPSTTSVTTQNTNIIQTNN